ncbi:UDP-N-acetylglucosamine 2-epimerase [bacterium]|nr:UDP-N-acetylglucosamine 2-epimerase [candidate division CSSED10-310 bacterium]
MEIRGAFDSMFPESRERKIDDFVPDMLPMTINEALLERSMKQARDSKKWVLAFVIGTKPCFYKFYGSVVAAAEAGLPFFVIDSNQHYDEILTYGRYEFNFQDKIGANLAIRGDLLQKSVELLCKMNWLGRFLRTKWPDVPVVPVVLGDTIMTSIVPAAWMFSRQERAIHNEAGLRSMAPDVIREVEKGITVERFVEEQFNGPWRILRNEPFPEQWDTFVSSAGCEFMFAPTELNRQHLLREGYPEENVFVTGGVVVEALELKLRHKPSRSIFDIYPRLAEGQWIRVDIHRRGNLTSRRFHSLVGALETLVRRGHKINFIEMNATRYALEKYGLKQRLMDLAMKHPNFLYTEIWPEFAHVIEFFNSEHCLAALTDSGGVQEEMNLLGKVCLTCRVNTDRPETVNEAHSNLLVPPIDTDFMVKMIEYVVENTALQERMRSAQKIYGADVGRKFIDIIRRLMREGRHTFSWAHEALGLWRETLPDQEFVHGYKNKE